MSQRPLDHNLVQNLRAALRYCRRVRATLQKEISNGWDRKLSLDLDRVEVAEENLNQIVQGRLR